MKKLLLSLAVVFFSLQIFAVSIKDFSLSVEPLFGMKYGQIDEYVFSLKNKQSSDKLSELNWEIKPELYTGIKIRGGCLGFFEETHFSVGLPMKTGLMMDSDWQNIELSTASGGNTLKTNYSESDNYLDYDISFGFKGGYEFTLFEIFKIKPAVAFEYQNTKFTAKNGSAWYGNSINGSNAPYYSYDDTEHRTISDFSGKDVIAYQRVSDFLWLGSDFSASLPHYNITVNVGFFVAAYVYAISYDTHFLKSKDYADKTTDYFSAFKWNFGVMYNITARHSVSINFAYFYMPTIRGDDYEKSSSQSTYKKSSLAEGGAGANWFDLSISYRFKIF